MDLDTSFDLKKFFLYPLYFYCFWVIFYLTINFCLCKSNIERNGYENLYIGSFKNLKLSQNLVRKYGNWCSYSAFILLHFTSAFIFNFTAFACFYSFIWHTILLIFYMIIAVKNAADFYMNYFSKNNENRLIRLAKADPTSILKIKKKKNKK